MSRFSDFHRQIAGIQSSSKKLPNLNPDSLPSNEFPSSISHRDRDIVITDSFGWLVQKYAVDIDKFDLILDPSILNSIASYKSDKIVSSKNGNIYIANLENGYAYFLRIRIFRTTSIQINIASSWKDRMAIYNNDGLVGYTDVLNDVARKNDYSLWLSNGWNNIDILILPETDTSFLLGSELGNVAENWAIGGDSNSIVAPTLSATTREDVYSSVTSSLQWYSVDSKNLDKYNIYRMGPYDKDLGAPVITGYSGVSVRGSGLLNTNIYTMNGSISEIGSISPTYYSVSTVYNDGLESLPSSEVKVYPGELFSGIKSLSGYPLANGNLSGLFTYLVTASVPHGDLLAYRSPQTFSVFTTGSTIINFTHEPKAMFYKIYRASGVVQSLATMMAPNTSSGIYIHTSLATVTDGIVTFIDSGSNQNTFRSSGVNLLKSIHYGYNANYQAPQVYNLNGARISWKYTIPSGYNSGLFKFKIYKTNSSQVYEAEDDFTPIIYGNSFLDSGKFSVLSGEVSQSFSPISFKLVNTLNSRTTDYSDPGLQRGAHYDYAITSLASNGNESALSNSATVIVGKFIPPSTPSGLFLSVTNGFANINWVNGTEVDLAGTKIYQSSSLAGTYNLAGNTTSNIFNAFIGYSGVSYFKLSNFNVSSNESPLTTGLSGIATSISGLGIGNVLGPVPSTDNAIARYDGTTGKIIQNSIVTVSDNGTIGAIALVAPTPGGRPVISGDYGYVDIYSNGIVNMRTNALIISGSILAYGTHSFYPNQITKDGSIGISSGLWVLPTSGVIDMGKRENPFSGVYSNNFITYDIMTQQAYKIAVSGGIVTAVPIYL